MLGGVCLTVHYYDSYGDGWDGAEIVLTGPGGTAWMGTLETGQFATSAACFSQGGCLEITVSEGAYPSEVTWMVVAAASDGGATVRGGAPYEGQICTQATPTWSPTTFDPTALPTTIPSTDPTASAVPTITLLPTHAPTGCRADICATANTLAGLMDALAMAVNGSVAIDLRATIVLVGGALLIDNGMVVTFLSSNGQGALDGRGLDRVLVITGETTSVWLQGIEVTDGYAQFPERGGCIWSDGAMLEVDGGAVFGCFCEADSGADYGYSHVRS